MWTIIGSLAACFTMLGFIPQIIKVLKTRSVHDVSIITIVQFSLGVSLWIAYGVHLKDYIIIFANAVSLFTLALLFVLYFKLAEKNRRK